MSRSTVNYASVNYIFINYRQLNSTTNVIVPKYKCTSTSTIRLLSASCRYVVSSLDPANGSYVVYQRRSFVLLAFFFFLNDKLEESRSGPLSREVTFDVHADAKANSPYHLCWSAPGPRCALAVPVVLAPFYKFAESVSQKLACGRVGRSPS